MDTFVPLDVFDEPVYDPHADIKTGDVLVWRQDRLSAISNAFLTLVRFATRSDFAHVGVALRLDGRLFVVEATIPRVRIAPVTVSDEFYHISSRLDVKEDTIDWLLSVVGVSYSFMDCLRAYFGKPLERQNAYQCAELVSEFFLKNDVDLGTDFTPTGVVNAILRRQRTTLDTVSPVV